MENNEAVSLLFFPSINFDPSEIEFVTAFFKSTIAGTCHDVYSAERLSKSINAQILTMRARVIGPELAKMVVAAWVKSEFEAGRSLPKVERMRELERKELAHGEGAKTAAKNCC